MPSQQNPSCRLCGSPDCDDRGPIFHPKPTTVAGVAINLDQIVFHLLACRECGFQFKHPPIPEDQLLACYRKAEASHWKDDPNPHERQFDVLRNLVEKHAPLNMSDTRRILDVGCFNGAILSYIGDNWERFGVEPSIEAANRARQRGVTILGPTIHDLPPSVANTLRFDAILIIDVIEHVLQPLELLQQVRSLLKPSGIIIIGTGDTDAWSWRLQGSRYWYCSMVEHVSFFGERAMEELAARLNMRTVEHLKLSHIRANPIRRWRKTIRNLIFEAARRSSGFGIPSLNRSLQTRSAPGWLTARDHMLHILRSDS